MEGIVITSGKVVCPPDGSGWRVGKGGWQAGGCLTLVVWPFCKNYCIFNFSIWHNNSIHSQLVPFGGLIDSQVLLFT